MQYSTALLALAASASMVVAVPDGCQQTYPGHFSFSASNVTSAPAPAGSKEKRQSTGVCSSLDVTLNNGILHDSHNRQGEIVANYQFQFDNPLQSGRKAESGFSICSNGTLALDSAIFYQCLSGGFYNLYSQSLGLQCNEVYLIVEPCTPSGPESTGSIGSQGGISSTSMSAMPAESMLYTASSAATTPSAASATPTSMTTVAPVATGTGSMTSSTNGTVSTAAPTPESFKGAASSVSVGQALIVALVGFAGLALL